MRRGPGRALECLSGRRYRGSGLVGPWQYQCAELGGWGGVVPTQRPPPAVQDPGSTHPAVPHRRTTSAGEDAHAACHMTVLRRPKEILGVDTALVHTGYGDGYGYRTLQYPRPGTQQAAYCARAPHCSCSRPLQQVSST